MVHRAHDSDSSRNESCQKYFPEYSSRYFQCHSSHKRSRHKRSGQARGWTKGWAIAATAFLASGCGGGGGGGYGSSDGGGGAGCGSGYGTPCSAGSPSVTLSVPTLTPNRTIALSAVPTAPNGTARVDFLVDGTLVGSATTAPYTTNWDTSTGVDGAHSVVARVSDAMGLTASSSAVTVTVANVIMLDASLVSSEEFPKPTSAATGSGQLTANLISGALSGQVTVTGMTPTAAHIHDAYAGNNGAIAIGLTQNAGNANRFDVPGGTVLTSAQVDKLLAGALYLNVHSAAYPAGEIRAQLRPANVKVVFTNLTGTQEVPAVSIAASGTAAITVDLAASLVSVHVKSSGVSDATMSHIHKGAAGVTGPVFVTFAQDATLPGHWFIEKQAITASDIADFNNGAWYVNVHTPAFPDGAIRGQVTAPATLAQLQTAIFTPRCSGCHMGGGASLPSSMNLTTAANTYAALVGVTSVEHSTTQRVKINDSANSYVIQKLEGAAGIAGVRMPAGGPFLDQPTIDQVKSWIDSGALNN